MTTEIIRSRRKTVSIEITSSGGVIVRVPYKMSLSEINRLIESKTDWIEKHIKRIKEQADTNKPQTLTAEQIRELTDKALEIVPKRAEYFAKKLGVSYGRITIRNQKTRWGSCSGKGNLNFNCLLMLAPPEVLDYVVVHELCHRREMNHSDRFWKEVEKILPDYKVWKKWLKENGGQLIAKIYS